MDIDFVTISGFEQYEINRKGEVYFKGNKNYHRHKKVFTLANNGYWVANLWDGHNHYKQVYLHRLLANAFIENPNGYKYVNHIDGNKANYSLDNLEWCTHKQNMDHARKHGLIKDNKPIKCIENNKIYYSQSQASLDLFGTKQVQSIISAQLRGRLKHVRGFHFTFV